MEFVEFVDNWLENQRTVLPQKWMIRLSIEGDLRFLSHHDCLRAIERTAARAGLPLAYSQGFNPHPVLSLALPRPVGVAAADDVLMISLTEPMEAPAVLAALNRCAPRGMSFTSAAPAAGKPPQAVRAFYRLGLEAGSAAAVAAKLEELRPLEHWPRERVTDKARKAIDLRPLVEDLRVEGDGLEMTLRRQGDLWARPSEVLAMLGLDERVDLARLVRRGADYEIG